MSDLFLLALAKKAFLLVILVTAPSLIFAMLVGLLMGALMAASSIQEATLSFFPKLMAILLSFVLFGPLILRLLSSFTTSVFRLIPEMVR